MLIFLLLAAAVWGLALRLLFCHTIALLVKSKAQCFLWRSASTFWMDCMDL